MSNSKYFSLTCQIWWSWVSLDLMDAYGWHLLMHNGMQTTMTFHLHFYYFWWLCILVVMQKIHIAFLGLWHHRHPVSAQSRPHKAFCMSWHHTLHAPSLCCSPEPVLGTILFIMSLDQYNILISSMPSCYQLSTPKYQYCLYLCTLCTTKNNKFW